MAARRYRFLYLIIALMIVFLLSLEFFLPALLANMLEDYLRKEADSIVYLKIELASFPAVKLLRGKIDQAEIELEGLLLDELSLDKLDLHYKGVILKEDGFTGHNTWLEAIISEEALNNYIKAKFPELEAFQLELRPDQVYLAGKINFFEMVLELQLSGNFIVNDQREVYFIPANVRIENIDIPVNLLKAYIEGLDFSFNLEDLNIPLAIDEIKLNSGYLILLGGDNREEK